LPTVASLPPFGRALGGSTLRLRVDPASWRLSISKVQQAFERGIKRDDAMLLVAPGESGRLVGFLLFELIAPWFSDTRQTTETCIFVEPGHRRSVGARELRKFAAWHRRETLNAKLMLLPRYQSRLHLRKTATPSHDSQSR
jgi:hypothetical protein